MRNTFRYAPEMEDYIKYYTATLKGFYSMKAGMFCVFFIAMAVYYGVLEKNLTYTIGLVICAAIMGLSLLYTLKVGIKKKAIKQISKSKEFFENREITITPNSIETRNLPEDNEAQIIGIYPYNIMKLIYETSDQFIFIVGGEAKLLPKRIIPPEMQEEVFENIRKSNKCVKINKG